MKLFRNGLEFYSCPSQSDDFNKEVAYTTSGELLQTDVGTIDILETNSVFTPETEDEVIESNLGHGSTPWCSPNQDECNGLNIEATRTEER